MFNLATWIRECDEHWFGPLFARWPAIVTHNARECPVDLSAMDALLLTGGGDISTEFLTQKVTHPQCIIDTDPVRDQWEFSALRETLAAGKPLLAICRGLQVLNVVTGGTLHLDIPDHDIAETTNIQKLRYDSAAVHRFSAVNSSHHQAVDSPGHGIIVEGWSSTDDVVEQARLREYPFAIGVQYHPERHAQYRSLFDDFYKHLVGVRR
ncbi:MAG TPA: gamma-glutamyl-gamma-aminobutyrate hydrolase family protein [Candidatus Binataceae bacterium]|nr:gamma-glutamyl-gamma-aminobutyrate hydrolase family protein [Candidatus Binataceae bacterium]